MATKLDRVSRNGICSLHGCANIFPDLKAGRGKYQGPWCSEKCFHLAKYWGRKNRPVGDITCSGCGCIARVGMLGGSRKSWCRSCKNHPSPRPDSQTCQQCGVEYLPNQLPSKYCGPKCRYSSKRNPERQRIQSLASQIRHGKLAYKQCTRCKKRFRCNPTSNNKRLAGHCSPSCLKRFYLDLRLKFLEGAHTTIPWAQCRKCRVQFIARRRLHPPCTCPPYDKIETIECLGCGVAVDTIPEKRGSGNVVKRCPPCRKQRTKETEQQARRRRRARLAGVPSEPYATEEIGDRDNWRCHICRKKVSKRHLGTNEWHDDMPTIDHLLPVSEGGHDTRANVALAHAICNSRKTDGAADDQLLLFG